MDFSPVVPILVVLFVVVVAGVIGILIFLQIALWFRNNKSPIQTVEAKVVTKRLLVRRNLHGTVGADASEYYATFERDTGARFEFGIGGDEYGLLAEGDEGTLTFQGTRYKKFQRRRLQAGMAKRAV